MGHHDQIPRLLAHFENDGEFYLVQELISGPSLQSLLAEHPQWLAEQVVQLLTEILEILTFVHSQGVIHRDIKPDNILYRQTDNHWVLIDFGAVKQLTVGAITHDPNNGTMAIYSEGYSPSEQLEGHPCSSSDLYALGLLCLQCLTGQHPNVLKPQLQQKGLTWLNQTVGNPSLAAILEKMTRSHYHDRYPTTQAVLNDLTAIAPVPQASSPANSPAQPFDAPLTARKYTPTVIAPPKPPPKEPKLKIPTEVLPPLRSPASSAAESGPRSPIFLPQPIPSATESTSISTGSPSNCGSNLLQSTRWHQLKARSSIWRWLKGRNIYRVEDAIGALICIFLLLGSTTFLLWWVASAFSGPRQRSVTTTQPVTSEALIATLSGEASISDLAFSPDSKTLYSATATGEITIWDLASLQPVQNLESFGAITALAVSTDGIWLASDNQYANIDIWNLQTGKRLHTLQEHHWPISALTFNPSRGNLYSAAEDGSLMIWDVEKANLGHQPADFSAPVTSMKVSPDGTHLVGGSTDFTLKVWDINAGNLVRNVKGHSGSINSVAVSSNSAVIASGSDDQLIKVWNLYTGGIINTLSGHFGAVTSIDISPDGRKIVSGGEDGTLRIWHLYSGEFIQKLNAFDEPIKTVKISSDGQLIASSTGSGDIHLWRMLE